jgi:hypothetical protein
MLISINRDELVSLSDDNLINLCIGPTIDQVRGQNLAVKGSVFKRLSAGQRAVFMFAVFEGHARNGIECYLLEMEYVLRHKGFFSELKNSIRYFGDTDLECLIGRIESQYLSRLSDDAKSREKIHTLDDQLKVLIPATKEKIAEFLRKNPRDFFLIEN